MTKRGTMVFFVLHAFSTASGSRPGKNRFHSVISGIIPSRLQKLFVDEGDASSNVEVGKEAYHEEVAAPEPELASPDAAPDAEPASGGDAAPDAEPASGGDEGSCAVNDDCEGEECCSRDGFCGTGTQYCDPNAKHPKWAKTNIGACSEDNPCTKANHCCSEWGYCGSPDNYCNLKRQCWGKISDLPAGHEFTDPKCNE